MLARYCEEICFQVKYIIVLSLLWQSLMIDAELRVKILGYFILTDHNATKYHYSFGELSFSLF